MTKRQLDPFKDLDKRSRLALRQALQDGSGSGAAPSEVVKKLETKNLVRRSGHVHASEEWGKVVRRLPVFWLTEEGKKVAKEIVDKLYDSMPSPGIHHSPIKTAAQLDAEIAEALAARPNASKHASKHASKRRNDPKIVMIEGEPWRVERTRFWSPDRLGGTLDRVWNFVRVSDGRTMTSDDKARGIRILSARIRDGTYAGPPSYRGK